MERQEALQRRYIQIHGVQRRYLPFDIDRPGAAFAWEDAGLPAPTITTVNPENGHAHLLYELEVPVVFPDCNGHGKARKLPINYYKAVRMAYGERLGADPAYRGITVKNPLSPQWRLLFYDRPRDLGELAESVSLKVARSFETGMFAVDLDNLGIIPEGFRNESVFEVCRRFAYAQVRLCKGYEDLFDVVMNYAGFVNSRHCVPPLNHRELCSIVRSIVRYCESHREAIIRDTKNRGAMNLGAIPPEADRQQEIKARKTAGAKYTAQCRSEATAKKIKDAMEELETQGKRISKSAVARLLGMERCWVSKRYGHLFAEGKKLCR